MKLSNIALLPDKPSYNQLKELTVDELIMISKNHRSIKKPFKKYLIEYVQSIVELRGTWRIK